MVNNIISKGISEHFSGYYFFIVMSFWMNAAISHRIAVFFMKKIAHSVFLKRYALNFVA